MAHRREFVLKAVFVALAVVYTVQLLTLQSAANAVTAALYDRGFRGVSAEYLKKNAPRRREPTKVHYAAPVKGTEVQNRQATQRVRARDNNRNPEEIKL